MLTKVVIESFSEAVSNIRRPSITTNKRTQIFYDKINIRGDLARSGKLCGDAERRELC